MNTEENIFAGLPNDKIILRAIAQPGLPNPFNHMSIKSKKVLDELTSAQKAGTLKVVNVKDHPEQDPFQTNAMVNFSDSRHTRCRGGYTKRF